MDDGAYQRRVASKQDMVYPGRAVYYYRMEHPVVKLVPIGLAEFRKILHGLGYLLAER